MFPLRSNRECSLAVWERNFLGERVEADTPKKLKNLTFSCHSGYIFLLSYST